MDTWTELELTFNIFNFTFSPQLRRPFSTSDSIPKKKKKKSIKTRLDAAYKIQKKIYNNLCQF